MLSQCKHRNETNILSFFIGRCQVLELEPQNKAAINQVTICKRVVRESHEKEKKLYANMFTKFANVDNEVYKPMHL